MERKFDLAASAVLTGRTPACIYAWVNGGLKIAGRLDQSGEALRRYQFTIFDLIAIMFCGVLIDSGISRENAFGITNNSSICFGAPGAYVAIRKEPMEWEPTTLKTHIERLIFGSDSDAPSTSTLIINVEKILKELTEKIEQLEVLNV